MSTKHTDTETMTVKVWDFPTRLFHWLLIILFVVIYASAKLGEMDIHFTAAFSLSGLIIFRVMWGFLGSTYALFSQFVSSPKTTLNYLKSITSKDKQSYIGHNPAGGWVVIIFLLAFIAIISAGLISTDDIYLTGPFYHLVTDETASLATTLHRQAEYYMLGLIALHVIAVLIYKLKFKENLVKAMVTGKKEVLKTAETKGHSKVSIISLVICISVSVAWVTWLMSL